MYIYYNLKKFKRKEKIRYLGVDDQIQTFRIIKLSNKFFQFIKPKFGTTSKIEFKLDFLQTWSIKRIERQFIHPAMK